MLKEIRVAELNVKNDTNMCVKQASQYYTILMDVFRT